MNQLLTVETPGKVMSLLGASILSLAFLFTVSYSNASFAGTEVQVPDMFSPQNVVAMVDTTTNAYSSFLNENLIQPAQSDFVALSDMTGWTLSNAKDGLAMAVGLPSSGDGVEPAVTVHGRVAGAYTTRAHQVELQSSQAEALLAGKSAQ